MAWRPNQYLIEGQLDNTINGKIVGYMKFYGLEKDIQFNLDGNFHRDIRGAKIRFSNDEYKDVKLEDAKNYMGCFSILQTGKAGDITSGNPSGTDADGKPTYEYVKYGYIEWYSDDNGRCVLELESSQIEILSKPIPTCESDPIDRQEQHENMMQFINNVCSELGKKSRTKSK